KHGGFTCDEARQRICSIPGQLRKQRHRQPGLPVANTNAGTSATCRGLPIRESSAAAERRKLTIASLHEGSTGRYLRSSHDRILAHSLARSKSAVLQAQPVHITLQIADEHMALVNHGRAQPAVTQTLLAPESGTG